MIKNLEFEMLYLLARAKKVINETLWMKLAWIMPKKLVYWCGVRMAGHATSGDEYGENHPDDVSVIDMLKRWEEQS